MDRWSSEVASATVTILIVIFVVSAFVIVGVVLGGLSLLAIQGYQMYKRRNDPPHLGPWSQPGDVAAFGWNAGLRMGEETISWQ